ncbi:ankyrin repeat-containing protein ITN1 [Populus trichocarpa]|uniref:ankyrin repeat-containing protein ITN1 n=1 Tax=Populus trichocarpa TaxID=3694 RepID=UPI0022773F32|nr:ankyrin repeat-containing protein ITN1 [Populus trichocarpa]
MSIFSQFLYMCLPAEDQCDGAINEDTSRVWEAMESGQRRNMNSRFSYHVHGVLEWINGSICRFSFKGWPMVERIWENKRKLKSALQLAKMLIKSDVSWDQDIAVQGQYGASTGSPFFGPSHPLLTGTKTGILEVVSEMLIEQPHFLDLLDEEGKNILHVAIKYRRKDIFHLIKSNRIISNRMSYGIDKDGYTLLHQVADNKYYSVGSKHGPALQLHEESKWFTRVEKLIPSYYAKLRDSKQKTAEELFNDMHKEQLLAAQQWAKETSQSCSAVAVLVATIVFAAAYTVPGGSNDKGIPIFLN